jgi:exopolysaccharide biosynthesis protein
VRDGKVNPNLGKHRLNGANSRCSIGMVEPGHYFFVVSRNVTLVQHAQIYTELGCTLAYNMDGGNSSCMVFMGEQINTKVYSEEMKLGQRPLPELIVIGQSDLVPGVKDPVKGYNK